MHNTSIKSFIDSFRTQQSRSQLKRDLIKLLICTMILLLIMGLMELTFYFSIPNRLIIAEILILFFFVSILFVSLRYYLNKNLMFGNSSDHLIAHKFEEKNTGKACVIGTVEFEGQRGLSADSDGDVVLHALCNALTCIH